MSILKNLASFLPLYFILVLYFSEATGQSWVHYVDDGLTDMQMNSIATVGDNLIVSTGNIVTVIKNDQTISCNTTITPLLNQTIFNWMQLRSNGEIWGFYRVNDTHLYRFNGLDFLQLDTSVFSPLPPDIAASFETRSGRLWVCTVDSGSFILNGTTWQPVEGSPKGKTFVPCLEDSLGNIWGNVALDGVYCYKPQNKTWLHYTPSNSGLTTPRTRDIITDKKGNIIICSDEVFNPNDEYTSGIFVFNGSTWTKYDTSNTDMITSDALCMARDSTGNIWIGSRQGVIKWDGNNKWENMCGNVTPYKPCGFIHAIKVDSKNRIWVAGFHWGFFLFDQNGSPCEPRLSITSPTPALVTKPAVSLYIRWEYQGPVDDLKIEYRNNQESWSAISNKATNGKIFQWLIPKLPSSTQYQLRISSIDNPAVFDTSARFTIADSTSNIPPSFISLPDSVTVKKNEHTTLTIHTNDPDKDTIKFTYANFPTWVTSHDSVIIFEPITGSTTTTFTVTISDGKSGIATDSVKVVVVESTGIIYKPQQTTASPFQVNTTTSLLTVIPGNKSTISGAALYTLSGKKTSVFTKDGTAFTLHRKGGSFDNTIYILKVGCSDATGRKTVVSRLLLWQ